MHFFQIFSADKGRVKITTSGVFCAVTVSNVLQKDSGTWKLTVGTGEHLATFKNKDFIYDVSVIGIFQNN